MDKKDIKKVLFRMPAIEVYKLVLKKEINRFPAGFWMQPEALENAILCVRFMIEEILKWDDKTIKAELFTKTFVENKLSGMLRAVFNNSSYNAINSAYPSRFKEWDFKNTPRDFWTLENSIDATKWLIEQELKWDEEDIKEKLSVKIFKENNLYGMLGIVFNSSPYKAINTIYPNRFKEWEFKSTPNNFWTLEKSIKATKWLVEEKLKWTDEDIKGRLSVNVFIKNNLIGMLDAVFNNSPYDAINELYPNKFKRWQLKSSVPKNYWTLETGIESTKWLIEQKLKWTEEDIKEKLSIKTFKENNLGGMLSVAFNNSPFGAINSIYPNKFKKQDLKSYQYNFTKNK